MNILLILLGKLLSSIIKLLNLGNGSTWPGHIALSLNKNFIKNTIKKNPQLKIILIAGTNGKTTTSKLIKTILEKQNIRVIHNESGANLQSGIASSLLLHSTILLQINSGYAILEVDENSLPLVLNELTPSYLILLNLFRDQLDRYGEVNTIASKWKKAIQQLNNSTIVVANADDPQIAYIGTHARSAKFFGLDEANLATKEKQHASDTTYCPACGKRLIFERVYFSHIGIWKCSSCKLSRPKLDCSNSPIYPLLGTYNRYNTIAAILTAKLSNINNETIQQSLKQFKAAFGRQEIINVNGKNVQLFLSKNPTSMNQSLRTIAQQKPSLLLLVLNDRIPDGRDVSWIWDVEIEEFIEKFKTIIVSGDRTYDMALRIKYSLNPPSGETKLKIEENLERAIQIALANTPRTETLYVLPTYSAMLEIRKILTGKKIL